jgi:hypothetical protein
MKYWLKAGLSFALFLLLGWIGAQVLLDVFLGSMMGSGEGSRPIAEGTGSLFVLAPVVIGAAFLTLAIHEGGHLLGGWLAGCRPVLLVVGPLRVQWTDRGATVGFNRHLSLWGGLAASIPENPENARRAMLWVTAGGPLTSLVSGVALGLPAHLLFNAGAGQEPMGSTLALFLMICALGSLLIGVITLFPGTSSGFDTDGSRILRFLRGGDHVKPEASLLTLTAHSMGGTRPRDWEPELVEEALALPPDHLLGVVARQMASAHALDRGDPERAADHLGPVLERIDSYPGPVRPGLLAQGAYLAALDADGVDHARHLLGQIRGEGIGSRHRILLAQAAVSGRDGRAEKARDLLAQARAAIGDPLEPGMARAEREWIQALATEFQDADPPCQG